MMIVSMVILMVHGVYDTFRPGVSVMFTSGLRGVYGCPAFGSLTDGYSPIPLEY